MEPSDGDFSRGSFRKHKGRRSVVSAEASWSASTVGCLLDMGTLVTLGIHSTQRAEEIHSAIKTRRSLANFSLCTLLTSLIDYNETSRERKAVDAVRKRLHQIGDGAHCPPFISEIACETEPKVTSYANALLLAQTAQLLNYQFLATTCELDGCTVYRSVRLRPAAAASNLSSAQFLRALSGAYETRSGDGRVCI